MKLIVEEIGSVQEVEMTVSLIGLCHSVFLQLSPSICLHLLLGQIPDTILTSCQRLAGFYEVLDVL